MESDSKGTNFSTEEDAALNT